MHPLQVNLENLTDSEIEDKIKELTKKYFVVLQVSPSASTQVLMLLEDYKSEQSAREHKRQNHKTDLGDEFDGLINIG